MDMIKLAEEIIAGKRLSHTEDKSFFITSDLGQLCKGADMIRRHFKGDCYLVEDVARHSETGEEYVVYRKLYGDGSLWIRPKEMFLGEVDRTKYPDCPQRYRFELQEIESVAGHAD